MSSHTTIKRNNIPQLIKMKGKQKIVALTAYTYPQAQILDEYADLLLVGDSLGMVLYGWDSTLPVTLEDMIRHGECVVRGSSKACVIVDMPFGSYQASPEQAFENAALVIKRTGAAGVKLEGGLEMLSTVQFLVERAIPVMAHIGLKPQHVNIMGGYRFQGKDEAGREQILDEAIAFEKAGAFALLLEGVEAGVAAKVTASVAIPTIGIGAGAACDGQILVTEDMAGMNEHVPSFVQQFAAMQTELRNASHAYAKAVRTEQFPSSSHSFITKK
jgi:3-methyl-2-oxobutanoate hydroxymethyltransferase